MTSVVQWVSELVPGAFFGETAKAVEGIQAGADLSAPALGEEASRLHAFCVHDDGRQMHVLARRLRELHGAPEEVGTDSGADGSGVALGAAAMAAACRLWGLSGPGVISVDDVLAENVTAIYMAFQQLQGAVGDVCDGSSSGEEVVALPPTFCEDDFDEDDTLVSSEPTSPRALTAVELRAARITVPEQQVAEGYMVKRGGTRKNWQRRFFVLTTRQLTYYASEKRKNAKGVISVDDMLSVHKTTNASEIKRRKNCLCLVTQGRHYYFSCTSEMAQELWESDIKGVMQGKQVMAAVAARENQPALDMAAIDERLVRTGMMAKRGSGGWRSRWFVLTSWKLQYYADPDNPESLKGTINVSQMTRCEPSYDCGKRNAFCIEIASRVYLLFCETEAERNAWITNIQAVMLAHKHTSLLKPNHTLLRILVFYAGGRQTKIMSLESAQRVSGVLATVARRVGINPALLGAYHVTDALLVPLPLHSSLKSLQVWSGQTLYVRPQPGATIDFDTNTFVLPVSPGATPSTTTTTTTAAPGDGGAEAGVVAPLPPAPTLLKEGYVYKQGGTNRNWQRRWCVLSTDAMTYSVGPGTPAKGSVPISSVTSVASTNAHDRDHVFEVATPSRTFFLQASSASDADAWRQAFLALLCGDVRLAEGTHEVVIREGPLRKRGEGEASSVNSRWCTLTNTGLSYATKKGNEARGMVAIDSIVVAKRAVSQEPAFEMVTPDRTYEFFASSWDEVDAWIEAITLALDVTPPPPDPVAAWVSWREALEGQHLAQAAALMTTDHELYPVADMDAWRASAVPMLCEVKMPPVSQMVKSVTTAILTLEDTRTEMGGHCLSGKVRLRRGDGGEGGWQVQSEDWRNCIRFIREMM